MSGEDLAKKFLQPSNNVTGNQSLYRANYRKNDRRNPDELPVAMLYRASICRSHQVDATNEDESPV